MQLDRALLTTFHGYEDSARWCLTPDGLLIEGDTAPRGTGGPPRTVRRIWQAYGPAVSEAARTYDVPFELILATVATESRGNPNAERTEPGFISYAQTPSRVSVGLMQTLISTARQALRDPGIGPEALRDPATAIRAGTAYIASQAGLTGGDPPKVACAYNAGGIYRQASQANRWRMRQYPIGTGAHADRFVAWLNDAFILFEAPTGFGLPSLIDFAAAAGSPP
ncbi:MAG: transglycosylase SLT domain-containing protein [Alphaproteobacteria bacterium]|nr:transglycosylase SLT domain-containing protein [Alphaproteobacteria bacterium]